MIRRPPRSTLSLHDALPICPAAGQGPHADCHSRGRGADPRPALRAVQQLHLLPADPGLDRKSTRLNSSHSQISYAVFCLKKKKALMQRMLNSVQVATWTE